MKTRRNYILNALVLLALVSTLSLQLSTARAQGTAFTYQGRLQNGTNPANGSYDLAFSLYATNVTGTAIAGPVTNSAVNVTNGLFTTAVDFGNVFTGASNWLQLAVSTNAANAFTNLVPRQQLTPVPYAIVAENLGGTVGSGGLSGTYGNPLILSNAANQLTGTFTGNGGGLSNVNAATLNGLASSALWQLGGNQVAAGQFLGSTNPQPVEIWVNNLRVARFAYASNSASGYSPNYIAGFSGNFASNGVVGATIVGGGRTGGSYTPSTNQVLADFGTVVGGYGNVASGPYAVAMGFRSSASGEASTGMGAGQAAGNFSAALGSSSAGGSYSTALGNSSALAEGDTAAGLSTASGGYSTALGLSTAMGANSTGMGFSTAGGSYSTASGQSTANGLNATAMGQSFATNLNATASGQSVASGEGATAMGEGSMASGSFSTALGQSTASNLWATALGGSTAYGALSTASGVSTAGGAQATAMGASTADGLRSVALGYSSAYGDYSFAAGNNGSANHNGAFVWADSQPASFFSTGVNQFCIRAKGGIILDDTTPAINFGYRTRQMLDLYGTAYGIGVQNFTAYFRSSSDFCWYAGGVHSDTQDDPGSGGSRLMLLNSSGLTVNGTFVSSSDRNAKENFQPVSAREILEKVAALPVSRWNYKQDKSGQHLGPMAQDFYAAFNVGPDDKHIATVDEEGVALAAIQGLNEKVETRSEKSEARIEKLEAENAELKQQLAELKALLNQLAQKEQ
jgi:hypothetical protein